jgi:hypothetical protein
MIIINNSTKTNKQTQTTILEFTKEKAKAEQEKQKKRENIPGSVWLPLHFTKLPFYSSRGRFTAIEISLYKDMYV